MKKRVLFVAAFVVVLFAFSASACEKCLSDPNFPDLGYSCWSGYSTGYSWCYGGGKTTCKKPAGIDCPARDPQLQTPVTPGGVTGKAVRAKGILGCTECQTAGDGISSSPDGGFALVLD